MPTQAEIKRASRIAVKNMEKQIKTLSGSQLNDLTRFCNAILFTPSLIGEKKREFIKRSKK